MHIGAALTGAFLACALLAPRAFAQLQDASSPSPQYLWTLTTHIEGHLDRHGSTGAAFSPDNRMLAVEGAHRVLLAGLSRKTLPKALRPRVNGVGNLQIESSYFIGPDQILFLARGKYTQKHRTHDTPLLAIIWDVTHDTLVGKVHEITGGSNVGPVTYASQLGDLMIPNGNRFTRWNPVSGQQFVEKIPELTEAANLYTFSPNGQWLLLAQIAANGPNPVVVRLRDQKFVDALRGGQSQVLDMQFSRDSRRVVTASADGKVRLYRTSGWQLLATYYQGRGAARTASFSPGGRFVVSGGDDDTVKVWSTTGGNLIETLSEPRSAIESAAFSSDGQWIAASTRYSVYVWRRIPADP